MFRKTCFSWQMEETRGERERAMSLEGKNVVGPEDKV